MPALSLKRIKNLRTGWKFKRNVISSSGLRACSPTPCSITACICSCQGQALVTLGLMASSSSLSGDQLGFLRCALDWMQTASNQTELLLKGQKTVEISCGQTETSVAIMTALTLHRNVALHFIPSRRRFLLPISHAARRDLEIPVHQLKHLKQGPAETSAAFQNPIACQARARTAMREAGNRFCALVGSCKPPSEAPVKGWQQPNPHRWGPPGKNTRSSV